MEYGICNLGIIPARLEASDKAEIVTHVLFGEHFEVIQQDKKWIKIRLYCDKYEAWICQKQWLEITALEFDNYSANAFPLIGQANATITHIESGNKIPVTYGGVLPYYQNGHFRLRNEKYSYKESLASKDIGDLQAYAKSLLNTPYLWGGRGPLGIDCSGFTQLVYSLVGHAIPRDAYQQAEIGETIAFVDLAKPGDLLFFDNDDGRINHVGIALGENQIIHASGFVRIDNVDHEGIFMTKNKVYTHKLRLIKRIYEL